MATLGAPKQSFAVIDVVAVIIGLVIGAGIFKTPAIVAQHTGNEWLLFLVWFAGGLISLGGALCYAELASAYPDTGGEYHFLTRAYGRRLAFLFAWSRLAVLQTGSIALLAFVLGDYLSDIQPLGNHSSVWYAATAVVALTGLNIAGVDASRRVHNGLAIATVLGLVAIIIVGLAASPLPGETAQRMPNPPMGSGMGLAMIFVLLTYGGWNEAAYLSAELRSGREHSMARALVVGVTAVTLIYLLVNFAYLQILGIEDMGRSDVVTADAMQRVFGEGARGFVSALIALAVVTSINVTIMTGASSSYSVARDFPRLRFLATWSNAPTNALLVQGVIALLLVFIGGLARSGFETMVHYVSPVFWLFFLLVGLSLFVLRWRQPGRARPFAVPGYPIVPLLFIFTCGYMLYSSVAYTGFGALLGVAVLGAGLPLLFLVSRNDNVSSTEGDKT